MEEKHWFVIVDDKDHATRTMDHDVVANALQQKNFGVTEVKESVVYMENTMVRVIVHSQLKKPIGPALQGEE